MEISLFEVALAAVGFAAPLLVLAYIQRLPVAPACPSCRAVTREIDRKWLPAWAIHLLSTTYLGECTRCGWRGRMRWRWATRSVHRRDG